MLGWFHFFIFFLHSLIQYQNGSLLNLSLSLSLQTQTPPTMMMIIIIIMVTATFPELSPTPDPMSHRLVVYVDVN